MATTQEGFDTQGVASKIATAVNKALARGEDVTLPQNIMDILTKLVEGELKPYDKERSRLELLYDRSKLEYESFKKSTERQINDYEEKIENEKEKTQQEIERATQGFRKERDAVSKAADLAQEGIEKERAILEQKKKEAKAEIEKYKKETQKAQEDQEAAENAWQEERDTVKRLQEEVQKLESAKKESQAECKSWENEARKTAILREEAMSRLAACQEEAGPIKQKNRELQNEVDRLQTEVNRAEQTITKQTKIIGEYNIKVGDLSEELAKYKPSTPMGSTTSGSPVKGGLADQIGDGDLESTTPTSTTSAKSQVSVKSVGTVKSGVGVSHPVELNREREKNRQLEAKIEFDYVPRTDHEQTITEKNMELEEIKAERDEVQQAQVKCQTALKKLRDELAKREKDDQSAKKDEITTKELKATIKALENKIASLETENTAIKGDNTRQRDRIQDQDRQLKVDTERIGKLEQRERQQQTKISELKSQVAALDSNKEKDTKKGGTNADSERLHDWEQEREKLRKESVRLMAENQRLEAENRHLADADKERERLQNEVTRLAAANSGSGDADERLNDCERERERLRNENRRLNVLIMRLRDDIRTHEVERQALRDALTELENVINGNGQQADRTQAALDEQISIFETAQQDLMRSIEAMSARAVSQGRTGAETSRSLNRARREIERFEALVETLTVERDLLQDEVRLCVEAQQRGRQRARENAAAGGGAGDDGDGEPGPGTQPGSPSFLAGSYALFLATIQHSWVWGSLLAVLVMMLAVIIAEGRLYAEWKAANAHTRALYMTVDSRPTVCLGAPYMDYFWHTAGFALTGRWKFR
ncbi:hypothetical protein F5Y12DRAFT_268314 [Xylaria sp. FL1777]|nr:hypothetical protein F5Y12DRAFT_268314 [Xylaria sp. FL1777]